MELSEKELRECARRIMTARMRLLCSNGFYGLLLMHIKMNVGTEHETAWSDGERGIYFNPAFLKKISDRELDYALMHVLMHLVLEHLGRKGQFEEEHYDLAADIVVNSNILRSCGGEEDFISLRDYGGVQPHLAPDGEDGWKYTVEELYGMLLASAGGNGKKHSQNGGHGGGGGQGNGGHGGGGWDSHEVARVRSSQNAGNGGEGDTGSEGQDGGTQKISMDSKAQILRQEWQGWIMQAAQAMRVRVENNSRSRGLMPAFVERYLEDLKKPKLDWRTILEEFIQEEVNDYSFCPPDRRFEDSPFFLPDFNEKDFRVEKVLFMIDASGSMSDEAVTTCYSEIKGAIDQFNGKLEGWLGFFDACVTEPKPFVDEDEFMMIRPKGGGGTSFKIIFQYVREHMMEELPVSIVILTDGYAPFPEESMAMGIPVLWILTTKDATPPWGRIARMPEQT